MLKDNQLYLSEFSKISGTIFKGDPAITPYLRDSMVEGDPDVVLRPRDIKDLGEMVRLCGDKKIPATICGGRTSMTGSAAALSGALIATEKLNRFISIDDKGSTLTATAETGIPLKEFKEKLEESGYFYPVHPTSVNDIFLGPTVATNATGDDTYKYGPTRRWVRRLKILLIDGRTIELSRPADSHPAEIKAKGGYYLDGPEIDRFIGSEGTLGIITEVTVDIIKGVPEYYSIMIPFPSNVEALSFIVRMTESESFKPRSLEFIDDNGLEIMKKHEGFPEMPEGTGAIVYSNTEFEAGKMDESVSLWLDELFKFGLKSNFVEGAIIAPSRKEKEEMLSWRHFIPDWINEECQKLEAGGGGKIGGDWWVPIPCVEEMMDWFYKVSAESKMPFIAYAHLGNGHPHTDYFARNCAEHEIGKNLMIEACKKAVSYGGGVAGEHGIGKTKRYLLPIQHPPEIIEKMRQLKSSYDPDWLLGQGNIFRGRHCEE